MRDVAPSCRSTDRESGQVSLYGLSRQSLATQLWTEAVAGLEAEVVAGQVHRRLFGRDDRTPRLGHFCLYSVLGRGGMGVVFRAHDRRLDRTVAIKVLRGLGAGDGPAADGGPAFDEARAMAQLAHANVVSVFEVGHERGLSYLAMEWIEGVDLRVWLDVTKRSRRQIVEVFLAAGRGLEAAHTRGIVHRDFKPENVLVDRGGRVKVADFGLARFAEFEIRDHAPGGAGPGPGIVSGTRAYLAPERLRGQPASPASDQYSFALAMREALHHRRRMVGFEQLPQRLREALDRACDPQPERRWPSMAALLRAIDPRTYERSVALRYRAGVGLAVVVLVWSTLGRGAGLAARECQKLADLQAQLWPAEARARMSERWSQAGLPRQLSQWRTIEAHIDRRLRDWQGRHAEVCRASERSNEADQSWMPELSCLAGDQRRLAALLAGFEQLANNELEYASRALAEFEVGPRCDTPSRAVERELAATEDSASLAAELLQVELELLLGRYNAGSQRLARLEPEVLRGQRSEVLLQVRLLKGRLATAQGVFDEAENILHDGLERALELGHLRWASSFAVGLTELSALGLQKPKEALLRSRYAQALLGRPQGAWQQRMYRRLELARARSLTAMGQYADAEAELATLLGGTAGSLAVDDPLVWLAHEAQGRIDSHLRRFDAAAEQFQQAATRLESTLGGTHPDLVPILERLGTTLRLQGAYSDALPVLARARKLAETGLGPGHPSLVPILRVMGICRSRVGLRAQAMDDLERARDLAEQKLGSSHPELARVLSAIGTLRFREHAYAEALKLHERALAIYAAEGREAQAVAVIPLINIADALRGLQRYAEAETFIKRALQLEIHHYGRAHTSLGTILDSLWVVLDRQGKSEEAARVGAWLDDVWQAAIIRAELDPEVDDQALSYAYNGLIRSLWVQARDREGAELRERWAAFAEGRGIEGVYSTNSLTGLVRQAHLQGRDVAAVRHLQRLAHVLDTVPLPRQAHGRFSIMYSDLAALLAERSDAQLYARLSNAHAAALRRRRWDFGELTELESWLAVQPDYR